MDPDDPAFRYDELSFFAENCREYGIDMPLPPPVERREVTSPDGRQISALRWGTGPLDLVLCHGGAQNAHTWDTVLLALLAKHPRLSALAVDLPGHGRSSWRTDGAYDPHTSAVDVAAAMESVHDGGPRAVVLVGMSLGGLVSICLASARPELVSRLVTVDITPGVNDQKASAVLDFVAGPQTFPSFEEIFARTVEFNPTRSPESLRRGILHNAHRRADGSWAWNYDRGHLGGGVAPSDLWREVAAVRCPYLLVRGADSPVVDDDDVAELRRLQPDAAVEVVAAAGHSVQGDQPLRLAGILSGELP